MSEAERAYQPRRGDGKRRGVKRKEQGWFRGRITWAVFFLTLVQFTVFVVEIVRNGALLFSLAPQCAFANMAK
jgi:hypothetical protein